MTPLPDVRALLLHHNLTYTISQICRHLKAGPIAVVWSAVRSPDSALRTIKSSGKRAGVADQTAGTVLARCSARDDDSVPVARVPGRSRAHPLRAHPAPCALGGCGRGAAAAARVCAAAAAATRLSIRRQQRWRRRRGRGGARGVSLHRCVSSGLQGDCELFACPGAWPDFPA